MRILITATDKTTTLDGIPCRLWQGVTERGHPCDVFVLRIGSRDLHAQEELEQALRQMPPPSEVALKNIVEEP